MLEHNRVIPREVLRDFHVIWLTVVVKQSPIHWFGGLTIYVEALLRTTNELRVGVLVMDRGGSDVTLDYARVIGLRSARACSRATLFPLHLLFRPINEYLLRR